MSLSVYERIIRAHKRGTGIKLSMEDVWVLSMDTAIIDAADAREEERELEQAREKLAKIAARREELKTEPIVRSKKIAD